MTNAITTKRFTPKGYIAQRRPMTRADVSKVVKDMRAAIAKPITDVPGKLDVNDVFMFERDGVTTVYEGPVVAEIKRLILSHLLSWRPPEAIATLAVFGTPPDPALEQQDLLRQEEVDVA